ncbi:MAG: TadE/TadG family type IV pilus assembly protein [Bryobacteraceae bacterium]
MKAAPESRSRSFTSREGSGSVCPTFAAKASAISVGRAFPHAGSRRRRGGNVMIEFAISIFLLFAVFGGTFQFGYAFYVYNLLCTQIRAGARYAAVREYKCATGASITAYKDSVKNMVAYGKPNPGAGDGIIVPGLSTANVEVSIKGFNDANADGMRDDADHNNVPDYVEVSPAGFTLNALFVSYTFTAKPIMRITYVGRYAPQESE